MASRREKEVGRVNNEKCRALRTCSTRGEGGVAISSMSFMYPANKLCSHKGAFETCVRSQSKATNGIKPLTPSLKPIIRCRRCSYTERGDVVLRDELVCSTEVP